MTTQTAQTETEQRVADMTVAELRKLIWGVVAEAITDLVGDPDEGLELSDWAQSRLDQASADRAAGERHTIPLEEVARRHGLSL